MLTRKNKPIFSNRLQHLEDDFIDNDLYQMFQVDMGLYALGLFIVYIFFFFKSEGVEFTFFRSLAFVITGVTIPVVIILQRKRLRSVKKPFFRVNFAQLAMIAIVLVAVVYLGNKYLIAGHTFLEFCDEVLIASWENLAFGILLPIALLFVFQFYKVSGKKRTVLFFSVTTISSLAFAFAHWWAYEGSLNAIGWLFGVGLLMMNLCYMFSPSASIVVHLALNVILVTKYGILL